MAYPFANTIKFLTAVKLLASPSGATIKSLMDNLNISRRTAFRLLESLGELGFPIIDQQPRPGLEKTYRLMESYVLRLPNVTLLNPGFTGEEIETILAMLEYCEKNQQFVKTSNFATIKQKISTLAQKPPDTQPEGST